MDFNFIIDHFLHFDKYLNAVLNQYNVLAYVLLFIIIFIETGLVIMPFLPGDSLLFAAGAIAAAGGPINIPILLILLYIAAVSGDTMNYHIGHLLREKIQKREAIPLVNMKNIEKAQDFLKKHGGKTITIARFIPIIRTFAPFVAGAGKMSYRTFLTYNMIGGITWVTLLFGIGYFFGNISYVKTHFSLVII
ncbi:MAG TPA: VTT domain-containing protein, partial [Ruminiclostridium sp.]|nr:VTT domain-containing protein [Ruminiclostridium sp.]